MKKQEITETRTYAFRNIKELAELYAENFIGLCESAYGKDKMTTGEIPMIELLKAIYNNSKAYWETPKMTFEEFIEIEKKKF